MKRHNRYKPWPKKCHRCGEKLNSKLANMSRFNLEILCPPCQEKEVNKANNEPIEGDAR